MIVFAKVRAFSGGAPISLLEYIKILQNNGIKIVVGAEFTSNGIEKKFRESIGNIKNIKALNNVGIISKITSLFKSYNLMIKNNVDALIVTTGLDIYFFSFIADLLKKPIILIVAGGQIEKYHFVSKWGNHQLICYSEENYKSLIEYGYDKDKIHIITNRITYNKDLESTSIYENINKNTKIKLLIITRVDSSKIKSIKYVIELTEFLLSNNENVVLKIAGDGPLLNEIKIIVEKINKKYKKEVVEICGFIEQTDVLINQSHIVFGKGRSVIEAIMMNHIGIVVSENNEMVICNHENFENLSKYNFSGRNIYDSTSFHDFLGVIQTIKRNDLNIGKLENIGDLVRKKYSSEYLFNQFYPILKKEFNNINESKNFNIHILNKLKIILRVFSWYFLRIIKRFMK